MVDSTPLVRSGIVSKSVWRVWGGTHTMPLIEGEGAEAVFAIAALAECNPFVPERGVLMQRALGPAYIPFGPVWHSEGDALLADPNAPILRQRVEELGAGLRAKVVAGKRGSDAEYDAYRGLVSYLLWLRYEDDWYYLSPHAVGEVPITDAAACYKRFSPDVLHFLKPLPGPDPDVPHLFALGFQMRRAFDHIFRRIYGGSFPAAMLRASVWESLFTHSARRYRSMLFSKMRDTPILITGESGTGKELVARAIALSQYVPFNPATGAFEADPESCFTPVNLSELPGSLVEAEMFGHARGAYTDAKDERQGCFEMCGSYGAVFLDEIGDLDPAVQLKLLRVLQSRQFQRLGENVRRNFEGKVIAATNRDLEGAMVTGRFRSDLYYRICADSIETPSLREQLAS